MTDPVIPSSNNYIFLTADEVRERRHALQSEIDKRNVHIIQSTDSKIPGHGDRELQIYQVVRPRSENRLQCKIISIWVPVEQFDEKSKAITAQKGKNTKLDNLILGLDQDKAAFFQDELKTEADVKLAIKRRNDTSRRRPLRR